MFVHQKAWSDACRVAEGHDPPAVSDVLCAQAADVAAAGDRAAAEDLYVRAAKPEKALQVGTRKCVGERRGWGVGARLYFGRRWRGNQQLFYIFYFLGIFMSDRC